MKKYRLLAAFAAAVVPLAVVSARPDDDDAPKAKTKQGQGIVIELSNSFIEKYKSRAVIEDEFEPTGFSGVHTPAKDGEIHVAGKATEAGLVTVAEVMNADNLGADAADLLRKATNAREKVKVTGAWRLWCEHAGGGNQSQGKMPANLKGSNPDHVFEIHPVSKVVAGDKTADARRSIRQTPGFTPKDAERAFAAYENVPCKIKPKGADRTQITTKSVGFNFTEFVIRLNEDPFRIKDENGGGHLVQCAVLDTDGELLVRNRRMVFIKGTEADDRIQALRQNQRMRVIGMPRMNLSLVSWRVKNKDTDPDTMQPWDVSPLEWDLPYEMVIVAAPAGGGGDDDD